MSDTQRLATLIRFQNALMTGEKLNGVVQLAKIGILAIQKCEKNPDGDGYFVTGYIDLLYINKETDNNGQ